MQMHIVPFWNSLVNISLMWSLFALQQQEEEQKCVFIVTLPYSYIFVEVYIMLQCKELYAA